MVSSEFKELTNTQKQLKPFGDMTWIMRNRKPNIIRLCFFFIHFLLQYSLHFRYETENDLFPGTPFAVFVEKKTRRIALDLQPPVFGFNDTP